MRKLYSCKLLNGTTVLTIEVGVQVDRIFFVDN